MSGNYTLALSQMDYEKEQSKYWDVKNEGKFRDEVTNLCDIGDTSFDLARIIQAFEHEKITEDFIEKMERMLRANGTIEEVEIDLAIAWFKKNIGNTFVLIYE